MKIKASLTPGPSPKPGRGEIVAFVRAGGRCFSERGFNPVLSNPLLALLCLFFLAGCHNAEPTVKQPNALPANAVTEPEKAVAALGLHLLTAKDAKRIVSLAPSITETLYALGLEPRIAGVTSACDYPPEAKQKPNVGGYPIDPERILALNPDFVFAQEGINTKETTALKNVHVSMFSFAAPKTLEGIYEAIWLIGSMTGTDTKAQEVVGSMSKQIEAVKQAVAGAKKPKVLILYGANPLYTTNPDSFIAPAIRAAGSDYLVKSNLPGAVISSEKVLLNPPDVIICSPEIQAQLRSLPGWAQGIPAVKNSRFYSVPNSSALVRPVPRLSQAIEDLARYLHPERFPAAPPAPKTP